jgi:hypothetical protein
MGARHGKLVGFDPEGKPIFAPKRTAAELLANLRPWQRHTFSSADFFYQSCRFCRRSIGDVPGLWKYGVRHYACDECRDKILFNNRHED